MHGINETGLQFQYTAPTDIYLMMGAEVLSGDNEQMFGNAEIHDIAEAQDGATLFVGYMKTGFDIGESSILTGLSIAQGKSHVDHTEDEEGAHAFVGDSMLLGFDFVAKHYFDSYSFLKLQTEVLYRDMDGTKTVLDGAGNIVKQPEVTKEQMGIYAQLVYAPNKTWGMGVRYDGFFLNDVTSNGVDQKLDADMSRYAAMVEYKTSEFARFRLQYNYDDAFINEDEEKENFSSIIFSANIAIGAHGAHAF
jgi:hypothetical protein